MKKITNELVLETQIFILNSALELTKKQRDYYRMTSNILAVLLGFMCVVTFLVSLQ